MDLDIEILFLHMSLFVQEYWSIVLCFEGENFDSDTQ